MTVADLTERSREHPLLPSGERVTLDGYRALFDPQGRIPFQRTKGIAEDSIAGRGGPIRLRRFLVDARSESGAPAILYFHGGGGVAGGLDSHHRLCQRIADTGGIQLVAVEYRLAPEHPFPAAVQDAVDAYAMLQLRAAEWGIDPARIALMGDGSGAALAAVVALHARDLCLAMPIAQLLLWPLADMTAPKQAAAHSPIAPALIEWVRRQQTAGAAQAADWRLSPLRADTLSGLPPTFVAVAGRDPFHQEGVAFAQRLAREGVETRLEHFSDHVRDVPGLIAHDGAAQACLEEALAFLAEMLDRHVAPVTV